MTLLSLAPDAAAAAKDYLEHDVFGETPSLLERNRDPNQIQEPVVRCSDHMCPIRVHWHVKENYKLYWRVKLTVTNLNIIQNYSAWNLVVQHPNLQRLTQVFSFNYEPLNQYGYISKLLHQASLCQIIVYKGLHDLTDDIRDPSKYGAIFEMTVGGSVKYSEFQMPENFSLGVPGYSCGQAIDAIPTKYTTDGDQGTWTVACMYSQSLASPTPRCCVSLSAFYNDTIVTCPRCSCGCQGQPGARRAIK
ncbi:unnamed protein product [Dovyalis caffra]|uniref:COBRA C-terminal domain-containing protein n=1 Tax=Dovyalis caffra TaxID=77055 RepID=A0AAV1SWS4_9ROSI|nr:unnamed protein product [Dovyalis caffra]